MSATAQDWDVASEAVRCSVSRSVASKDAPQIAAVSASVLDREIELDPVFPAATAGWSAAGPLRVFGPEAAVLADIRDSKRPPTPDRRLTFRMPVSALASTQTRLDLALGQAHHEISTAALADGLSKLESCRDTLLQALKIDPAMVARVASDAVGEPGAWITSDDMPTESAAPKLYSGYMVWIVARNGRIGNCRFAVSMGDAALETRLCRLIPTATAMRRPRAMLPGSRFQAGMAVR